MRCSHKGGHIWFVEYVECLRAYLQPLKMKEALAEGVLQEVVVPDLDEVDEHGALALALVRYQHSGEMIVSLESIIMISV